MEFYRLETIGDLKYNYELYYRVAGPPEGMKMRSYCLARGHEATPYYPPNAKVNIDPDPRFKGKVLTSLLGTTHNHLIVCSAMQLVIASFCQNITIEYLPFSLYDKKVLVSQDYCFLNPIGSYDCLDEQASGVEYGPEGGIVRIGSYILDSKKVANVPHLFRAQQAPSTYIVSEYLANALSEGNFSNVHLYRLAQV